MAVRVHELAKELGISSNELIEFINSHNYDGMVVKTASSSFSGLYTDIIKADVLAMLAQRKDEQKTPAKKTAAKKSVKTSAKKETKKTEKSAEGTTKKAKSATKKTAKSAEPKAKKTSSKTVKSKKEESVKNPTEEVESAENVNVEVKPAQESQEAKSESAAAEASPKVELESAPKAEATSVKEPAKEQVKEPEKEENASAAQGDIPTPQKSASETSGASVAVKSPKPIKTPIAFAPKLPPMPIRQTQRAEDKPFVKTQQPGVVIREASPAPKVPSMPPRIAGNAPVFPPRVAPKMPSVPPRISPMGAKPVLSNEAASGDTPAKPEKLKILQIKPPIVVRDFAKMMDLKSFRLISELMDMGIFASMNLTIEEDIARKIAARHGFELDIKHRGETQARQQQAAQEKLARKMEIEDDAKNLEPRPPIVCILGHVDHGKTTLLDTIRHTSVVAGEAGGITQHTAAYQVDLKGKKITFLDTPGHAAFSKMRERGANVTDIAILVVAADDGFMPQTDEALNFAQKAGVPVVVAINKIDAKGANLDRVKQQMQKRGIAPEEWGGETLCCGISALKGTNIEELLELVLLQAEMMELKANPKRDASGVVIESQIEQGRGSTATLIVQKGTLKAGDVIVAKGNWCKVRAMLDDKGAKLQKAPPSTPALVMGWSGAPEAGDEFTKVANDREARRMVEEYEDERRKALAAANVQKPASIEDLMAAIENKGQKVFKCVVKSDVSGTVEALVACLNDIKSSKVGLEVIGSSVGQITKNDVEFASTASASIVAFNVKQENGVAAIAKRENVAIVSHNIIYELINQVKDAMKELLDPELRENKLGAAEVRQIFNVSKGGKVAGCMVTEGLVKRDKFVRVLRGGKEIAKGKAIDIKRFKDDVSEVRAGYECGMSVSGFNDYQAGDILECYEILEVRPDL